MMDAITVLGMLAVVCGMLWAFQSEKLRLGHHEGDPKIRKTGRRFLRERFRPCFLCFE